MLTSTSKGVRAGMDLTARDPAAKKSDSNKVAARVWFPPFTELGACRWFE